MLHEQNQFEILAGRIERGDATAAPELRRLLEGALRPLVRRALRGGTSPLEQRLRALAGRVWANPAEQPAHAAEQAGASVASRVVGRLRAGADSFRVGFETALA